MKNIEMKQITHVVDSGCNSATVYIVKEDRVEKFDHKSLLEFLVKLPKNSFVVSEDSHLGTERTEFSLSQPFTRSELLDLYYNLKMNGVTLRLFPQMSTPRACAYAGLKKCDMNDPKSIYIFLNDHPKVVACLKKPVSSFDLDPVREASYTYKKFTDTFINRARAEQPKYSSDYCSKFLIANLDRYASSLSTEACDAFHLTEDSKYKKGSKKTGSKKGDWNISLVKMQAMYAIACTIIHPYDNCLRTREETGNPPGWKYIKKYIFRMTPFHFKGGIARSNLYYHGKKRWIISTVKNNHNFDFNKRSRGGFFDKKDPSIKIEGSQFSLEEDALFQKYRKQYCDATREFWQLTKRMAVSKYVDGVDLIEDRQLKLMF